MCIYLFVQVFLCNSLCCGEALPTCPSDVKHNLNMNMIPTGSIISVMCGYDDLHLLGLSLYAGADNLLGYEIIKTQKSGNPGVGV